MTAGLRQYEVPASAAGERLDHHLSTVFADLSRARIQSLIQSGGVEVNGQASKASRRLKGGEQVRVTVPPLVPAAPAPQDLPLSLLYEDEDIAVLDKAAGMVVHPAAGNWEGTLVNALLFHLKGLTGVGGEARPGLVHRLDKGTSGCMVIAKHDRALKALQGAFKARRVTKLYLAIVHGQPPEQAALRTPFGRHPVHRKRFTGRIQTGKLAVTEFVVRERLADAALLEVLLKTGRTHQIRVHLAELGHPLLGDPVYGGLRRGTEKIRAVQRALGRPALHAWKLQFLHPCTQIPMQFEAPIPDDFERARNELR